MTRRGARAARGPEDDQRLRPDGDLAAALNALVGELGVRQLP